MRYKRIMYKLFLFITISSIGLLTSIKNVLLERRMIKYVKFHNRSVKKVIKIYNQRLKNCSDMKMKQEKMRDRILNDKKLLESVTILDMQKLANSIDKLDETIVKEHQYMIGYLKGLFDKCENAVFEYNDLADKQNQMSYIFYKCNKIPLSSIIRGVRCASDDVTTS